MVEFNVLFQNLFFKRKMQNGEEIDRPWLIFSPKTKILYYGCCKLFSTVNIRDQLIVGLKDWKNAGSRLSTHENSAVHSNSVVSWSMRSNKKGLETFFNKKMEDQTGYWKQVLRQIIDVIFFLCERGLAFREKDELIGSPFNGNYLGLLELLSKMICF